MISPASAAPWNALLCYKPESFSIAIANNVSVHIASEDFYARRVKPLHSIWRGEPIVFIPIDGQHRVARLDFLKKSKGGGRIAPMVANLQER